MIVKIDLVLLAAVDVADDRAIMAVNWLREITGWIRVHSGINLGRDRSSKSRSILPDSDLVDDVSYSETGFSL